MKNKKTLVHCPNCKKKTKYEGNPYRPFCSKRCKMVDLGSWLKEEYRIPVQDKDGSEPITHQ